METNIDRLPRHDDCSVEHVTPKTVNRICLFSSTSNRKSVGTDLVLKGYKLDKIKSYDYVRAHLEATATIDFVPDKEEITVEYTAGKSTHVELHDGRHTLGVCSRGGMQRRVLRIEQVGNERRELIGGMEFGGHFDAEQPFGMEFS